ncbi:MAG: hypothetical protein HZY76_07285 [Anaerolineae bacterium]|nr:MAG: hypothetical protein HZY76_07285 [Anaerolineae bacterium]
MWTVFHRTEYPHTGSYCQGFCEGYNANFDHFLTVVAGEYTVRCGNRELPCYDPDPLPAAATNIYSRFAGRMEARRWPSPSATRSTTTVAPWLT